MFLTAVLVITAIWLFGAILAVAIMLVINLTILDKDPGSESYTCKEFVFGFIASWITIIVVSKILTDNL